MLSAAAKMCLDFKKGDRVIYFETQLEEALLSVNIADRRSKDDGRSAQHSAVLDSTSLSEYHEAAIRYIAGRNAQYLKGIDIDAQYLHISAPSV